MMMITIMIILIIQTIISIILTPTFLGYALDWMKYTLQFIDTHKLVFSVYYSLH